MVWLGSSAGLDVQYNGSNVEQDMLPTERWPSATLGSTVRAAMRKFGAKKTMSLGSALLLTWTAHFQRSASKWRIVTRSPSNAVPKPSTEAWSPGKNLTMIFYDYIK